MASENIPAPIFILALFTLFVKLKVKRYNIDPSRVTFELLENITMYSSNSTILETLKDIKLFIIDLI